MGAGHLTLLLGGARSGKSRVAERLAAAAGEPVTYVATAAPDDEDFLARVAVHRARRPPTWTTVDAGPDLPAALSGLRGTVLVDSIGTWVGRTPAFSVDGGALADALRRRVGTTVVVSEEVGFGVHPETEVGRRFRDVLGEVNQEVAAVADDVLLVVAGRVLRLDRPEDSRR